MLHPTHHELKIAYLKDRLAKLPRGNFVMHRDKLCIRLTYDPADPSVSYRNRKRIVCSSKEGLIYSPLVNESRKLQNELDRLLYEWNKIYRSDPRNINFPLKRATPSVLTKEWFRNNKNNQNGKENKSPIEYHGQILRTKNELLVCQEIERLGYPYKVEMHIQSDAFTDLYPDVTFYVYEIEKPICIEVDGALDNHSYFVKSENRKENYFAAGLIELKDVIFFRLYDGSSFDISRLRSMIDCAIKVNIDDLIL